MNAVSCSTTDRKHTLQHAVRHVESVEIARIPSTAFCMCISGEKTQNRITFDTSYFCHVRPKFQKYNLKWKKGKVQCQYVNLKIHNRNKSAMQERRAL